MSGHLSFTPRVKRVLENSLREAMQMGQSYISTEHLLLGIVRRARARRSRCSAAWAPRATTFARRSTTSLGSLRSTRAAIVRSRGRSFRQHAQGVRRRPHQEGENGELDPVIGRAAEIERVMQILSRRQKNNPLILGEPGVGKTAVVGGPRPAHRGQPGARPLARQTPDHPWT